MDSRSRVFRSLEMIEERISERLTVKALARDIHLSRYHYQRIFRDAVRDSVMKYVARRRLSLAAQELVKTDATVLEIALKYGYDSHEGFTRSFKARLGVTPTEYRKYFLSIASPKPQKEICTMFYGKNTDEIIRELNGLIVQAKETAACLRKGQGIEPQAWTLYAPLWEAAAERTEAMAGVLAETLRRITETMQRPDGISARFMLIKAIEDTAFQSSVSAFQSGLMMARAKPEHRAAFQPLCERYALLAQNARIKAEKIAGFFQELAAVIFQDMKEGARQRIEGAAKTGFAAAKALTDCPDLPYGYIAQELLAVAGELSDTPLEEMSAYQLENALLRLDIIALTAETDILRAPAYRPLFSGIVVFKERVAEALEFFRTLPDGAVHPLPEPQGDAVFRQPGVKQYSDLAFQGNVLLFYLRGEIQKLEPLLNEQQRAALAALCNELNKAVQLAGQAAEETDAEEIARIFSGIYAAIEEQAGLLGSCGAPLHFIAEEIGRCAKKLQECVRQQAGLTD